MAYGKFQTPEEVYQAYLELEKMTGKQSGELGSLRQKLQAQQEFIDEFGTSEQKQESHSGLDKKEMSKLVKEVMSEHLFGNNFSFGKREDGSDMNLADMLNDLRGDINLVKIGARGIPEIHDIEFQKEVKAILDEAKANGDMLSVYSAAKQAKAKRDEAAKNKTVIADKTKKNKDTKESVSRTSENVSGGTTNESPDKVESVEEETTPEDEIKNSIVAVAEENKDIG